MFLYSQSSPRRPGSQRSRGLTFLVLRELEVEEGQHLEAGDVLDEEQVLHGSVEEDEILHHVVPLDLGLAHVALYDDRLERALRLDFHLLAPQRVQNH